MTSTRPLYSICHLLMISMLLLASGCQESAPDLTVEPRSVKTLTIQSVTGEVQQSFSGRLHSTAEVTFSFRVSGTLKTLSVRTGDNVSAGDVIARLDPSDYELAVQRSRATLSENQATARNSKSNYERVKLLYQAGDTSRNQLDDARASAESSAAAVTSSRKALEIAAKDLDYATLKADRDCAIASVDKDEGENIVSGDRVVYATCGDELEVQLNIPESVISYIEPSTPAVVRFPAIDDRVFSGVVHEIGVSAVESGTTFPVDVLITDPERAMLKAGLSAEVTFTLNLGTAGEGGTLAVPSFAVAEDQAGRFVFTVESSEPGLATVNRTSVEVGQIMGDGIEIVSGLAPGMEVVIAGVSVLRDGMVVKASP
ncbi:MAG: efflux RND transporter periplasmic adaptor subunit [Pseudomonadota bacterium]